MTFIKYFGLILLLLTSVACSKEKNSEVDVSGIEVNTEVVRFEQEFYDASPEELPALKASYAYLFPDSEPDSVWIAKLKDEDELFLYKSIQKEFPDFTQEKEEFTDLFKHVKYYFPNFVEPRVLTILNNVDYDHRIIYADTLLFVSLDVYLGKEHEVYHDYPDYIKQNFTREHLIVDVAEQFALPVLRAPQSKSYVSQMIQQGKKFKLMESFLPEKPKNQIMGYTLEQYQWAEISEADIWKYFIQNEMLYSNDPTLNDRFIMDAPFSKFYLEVDKDSPGRIGAWFGWRIVDAFMQNNDISLQEMIITDNEEIFKRSKYKPKKK